MWGWACRLAYFALLMAAGCGLFVSEEALNVWVGGSLGRCLVIDGTREALMRSLHANGAYIASVIFWVYWCVFSPLERAHPDKPRLQVSKIRRCLQECAPHRLSHSASHWRFIGCFWASCQCQLFAMPAAFAPCLWGPSWCVSLVTGGCGFAGASV